jgi:hypothetical protein
MYSIATSQTFMKLLKTSLLLAAAATRLDAADYIATWNLTNGNVAKAIIGVDPSYFDPAGLNEFYGSSDPKLTRLDLSVTNSSQQVVWSADKSALTYMRWNPSGKNLGVNSTNVYYNGYVDFYLGASAGTFQIGYMNGVIGVVHTPAGDNFYSPFFFDTFGPSGVVDIPAWLSSVNNQNRVYAAGTTLASLPLEGAHHRPMMSFDRMGKDAQFWATGDFGSSSRVRDVKVTSGEMGVNKDIAPNTLAGIAIGRGQQNQDLALDGSNNVIGNYVLGEIDYRPFGSQWIVSLLGMVGSWDAKINRGYSNSGSTDYSLGETDITSRSARLRVDAPVLFSVGGFGFSPYASYAVTQTVVEAYTEAGGGLPASYDQQEHNATEARLGVMATKVFNEKLKLIVSLEGIHRFDGAGPALTGQDITGAVGFSLPGQAPRPDCVRLGFDVDYKLAADTLLNVSAHASTVGEVADVSGAVSIRRAF